MSSLMQTKTGTKAATVEPQEKRSHHDARIRDAHTTAFNVIVNLPVVQLAVTTIAYVMLHILATGYLTVCNRNRCNIMIQKAIINSNVETSKLSLKLQ